MLQASAVLLVFGGKKEYGICRKKNNVTLCVSLRFLWEKTAIQYQFWEARGLGETMSRHLGFGSQTRVHNVT